MHTTPPAANPGSAQHGPSYIESLAELVDASDEPHGLERVLGIEGKEIVWACAACGGRNNVRDVACRRCGTSFVSTARRVAEEETAERVQTTERVAATTLRGMAAATGAGPLAVPLVIAAGAVGVIKAAVGAARSRA